MTVRELYRAVLLRLRLEGIVRAVDESPSQFAVAIGRRFEPRASAALTQAYEADRYGERSTDDEFRLSLVAEWRARLEPNSNTPGTPR